MRVQSRSEVAQPGDRESHGMPFEELCARSTDDTCGVASSGAVLPYYDTDSRF